MRRHIQEPGELSSPMSSPMKERSRGGFMTPPVQRVLMTTDAVSSVWTCSLELCRALSARGVRVDLALWGGPLSAARGLEARDVPGLSLHEGPADANACEAWLLELEEQLAPDIIHLHEARQGALAWKAPTVVVAHASPAPRDVAPEPWQETVRGR